MAMVAGGGGKTKSGHEILMPASSSSAAPLFTIFVKTHFSPFGGEMAFRPEPCLKGHHHLKFWIQKGETGKRGKRSPGPRFGEKTTTFHLAEYLITGGMYSGPRVQHKGYRGGHNKGEGCKALLVHVQHDSFDILAKTRVPPQSK